ncbi:hypothetical protein GUJ93_ZPchr0033g26867 [Zizania palustris]|uniref:Trichome birefringence-like N-terminal domain-containing protein n=1 Tax=Zizania palustris TaxID=103762 RepID=A0A8J5UVK6_ZIZPA|nr:hypothetical protein GUJ93_ZPchr0033g26867 [Zizania palustris]
MRLPGQRNPPGAKRAPVASHRRSGRLPVYVAGVFFLASVFLMFRDEILSLTTTARSSPPTAGSSAGDGLPRREELSVKPVLRHSGKPERHHRVTERHRKASAKRPRKKATKAAAAKKTSKVAARPGPGVVDVPETCDLSKGDWVFDNASYPLYREEACEFLTAQVTCMRNGRRDDGYQKWRWQPRDCDLPAAFDAKHFMERLRGKRLMFVGDSLNRNQWESMVCLVQPALSPGKKYVTWWEGNRVIFHAVEYNATVEFYWAPFLVESNSDDPKIHSIQDRVIKPDAIAAHAGNWRGVDYLVFNTYIWWMNTLNMKVMRPTGKTWEEHDEVVRIEAYRRVLDTWATWVNHNVDPARTSVFFMSVSPLHISPEAWGNPGGVRCAKEEAPVRKWRGPLWVGTDWDLHRAAANASRAVTRVPVTFVDVTAMSERRKDAHTSVHTIRQGRALTPEQQADPATYADCIHWCLPGVPDVWNLMLYARIMSRPSPPSGRRV